MRDLTPKQRNDLGSYYQDHGPRGEQVRGPVWRGRKPRKATLAVARREEGSMAVVPDSPLARMLTRLKRTDRRLLLATIQTKAGPLRFRRERAMHRRFAALGIER